MDTNPLSLPVCTSKPLFVSACSSSSRLTSVEFPASVDDELAFDDESGELPDGFADEAWATPGDIVDAYVVVDRYGRRVVGEPVWATVGEQDLADTLLLQKAIDAALARLEEPEPEDVDERPWGHGPWAGPLH